jgi:hypothetical protein
VLQRGLRSANSYQSRASDRPFTAVAASGILLFMMDADGSALIEFANTMYDTHLGEGVDAFLRSKRFAVAPSGQRPRERRFAASSVVHAYAGLEAVASLFKFEAFDYEEGRFYREVARNVPSASRHIAAGSIEVFRLRSMVVVSLVVMPKTRTCRWCRVAVVRRGAIDRAIDRT